MGGFTALFCGGPKGLVCWVPPAFGGHSWDRRGMEEVGSVAARFVVFVLCDQ